MDYLLWRLPGASATFTSAPTLRDRATWLGAGRESDPQPTCPFSFALRPHQLQPVLPTAAEAAGLHLPLVRVPSSPPTRPCSNDSFLISRTLHLLQPGFPQSPRPHPETALGGHQATYLPTQLGLVY